MADDSKSGLAELKSEFAKAKNARTRLEKDWYMNLAYYMGEQWIMWNQGHIEKPKLESWRVEFTDNRMMPVAVARVSRVTRSRPTFICVPASTDEADIGSTELGEKILENDWSELSLDEKHLLAQFWKEITGAGFWKISWDKTYGDQVPFLYSPQGAIKSPGGAPVRADGQEAEIVKHTYGEQGVELEEKMIGLGNVCIEVMSPFEIFPDPLAETMEECEFWFEEKIRSKQYVEERYGIKNPKENAEVPSGIVESRMRNANVVSNPQHKKHGVTVNEHFCKPGKKYPQGRWVVWVGNQIVIDKTTAESPYAKSPYVMFSGNIVPGRFWPRSVMSDLRGPQTDLNKIQSQIRENAIRVGNPPIALSREANPEWDGRPGAKVWFSDVVQNALPTPIQMAEVPNYVRQEVERIENSISEISGIHDISKGQVPSGVTAASAINLLQEADDSRLGPEIQLMEKSIAKAGEYLLELHAQHDNGKKTIRLLGENSGWDIQDYEGEVLKNIVGVKVQAGSGMPHSKAARQAAMQELLAIALQYGVPLNQRAMRKFFQDFELGGLDKLFQDIERDEDQITRENRIMYKMSAANEESLTINDFDNDDLHIEGHQDEMKTAKWEKLGPDEKGIFMAHLKEHMKRKQAAVEMQAQTLANEAYQRTYGKPAIEEPPANAPQ